MRDFPDMHVTPYQEARKYLRPGMVAFFSMDTRGWKKVKHFASWRVKRDQKPQHECSHVGLIDVVRGRRVVIEATSPRVRVAPLSMFLGETETPDGKHVDAYDGRVYVGEFAGCDGEVAASGAWDNLLLPYDYLDIVALRLGIRRSDLSKYICSELVAEALKKSGVPLSAPHRTAYTPSDIAIDPAGYLLYRLR